MKYLAYWNMEKIKMIELKNFRSIELLFNFEVFPNIPTINFMDEDFLNLLDKEYKKIGSFFMRAFALKDEILTIKYDDFTDDETFMLLNKLGTWNFKYLYIIEKSWLFNRLCNGQLDKDYICIYSNERNTMIVKIIGKEIVEKKIISKSSLEEVMTQLNRIKKENPYLKVYGETEKFCDEVISEKEQIKNLQLWAKEIFQSRKLSRRIMSLGKFRGEE